MRLLICLLATMDLAPPSEKTLLSYLKLGSLHVEDGFDLWSGHAVLHLGSFEDIPWSLQFECFLLDSGAPLDLMTPCRSPKLGSRVEVSLPCVPEWAVAGVRCFGARATLSVCNGKRFARIASSFDVWPLGFQSDADRLVFVDLFCGAFDGWFQALLWFQANHLFEHRLFSLHVDCDYEVIKFLHMCFGVALDHGDEACHIGVCDKVASALWLSKMPGGHNMIWSLSPPCPPWSHSGKQGGLNTPEGRAFIEALVRARHAAPLALAFENAAGICKHPHFPLIMKYIKWSGYDLVWTSIEDCTSFSSACRKRWLGVAVRHDLVCPVLGKVAFGSSPIMPWSHEEYRFDLPTTLLDKLMLDENIAQFYSSNQLLPVTKRLSGHPTPKEVLFRRVPHEDQPLSTLVASYSQQHMLDRNHTCDHGICAELLPYDHPAGFGRFGFIDPFRWIALLGATHSLRVPLDLGCAFGFVGNAIHTVHAGLAFANLLNALRLSAEHIGNEDVARMWDDRWTASKACIIECFDCYAIMSPSEMLRYLDLHDMDWVASLDHDSYSLVCHVSLPSQKHIVVTLRAGACACDLLCALGLPKHLRDSWHVVRLDEMKKLAPGDLLPSAPVPVALAFHKVVQCLDVDSDSADECSPTAPWTQPTTRLIKCILPDSTVVVNWFATNDTVLTVAHFVKIDMQTSVVRASCNEEILTWGRYVGDLPSDTLQFHRSTDHKPWNSFVDGDQCDMLAPPSQPDTKKCACLLEVVLLNGSTIFVPARPSMTIAQVLVDAQFSSALIEQLVPSVNGCLVPKSTLVSDLPDVPIRLCAFPLVGGGKGGGKKKGDDPLVKNDPWAGASQVVGQCAWDQLVLSSSHPFHDDKSSQLKQVSKLQLGPQCGGVAMCTRTFLPTAVSLKLTKPTVLLLPAMKELVHLDPALSLKKMAMTEVIVEEPESKRSYKRMVLPLVLHGTVVHKFVEDPSSIQIDAEPFAELVFEILPKLSATFLKSLLEESPLQAFKQGVEAWKLNQHEVTLYALRTIASKGEDKVFQVLAKLPEKNRKYCLGLSGKHGLFCREFVQREPVPLDHAILPRYWSLETAQLTQCVELGQTVEGFRGVAFTPKGLAIRVDNSSIAKGRNMILQNDPRFNEVNRAILGKQTWLAMGFSFNMAHAAIVEAVHKSMAVACIPLRSYKSNGVVCWILGFDCDPPKTAFTIKVDSQICEVLLTKELPGKGKSKGGNRGAGPSAAKSSKAQRPLGDQSAVTITAATSNATERRLATLETKFQTMEHRQTALESKLDSRFDDLSSQLSQILHAATPNLNARPREAMTQMSESPPPKVSKAS